MVIPKIKGNNPAKNNLTAIKMIHFQVLETPASEPIVFRSLSSMASYYGCSKTLMKSILYEHKTYKRGTLPIGALITQIDDYPRKIPDVFTYIDKNTYYCNACEFTINVHSIYKHIKSNIHLLIIKKMSFIA